MAALMEPLTHLSLFSGIGGLDLAAEMTGEIVTVGQCEWAGYPTKVLEKHWPNVPHWQDIRTLTTGVDFYERTGLRTVDIVSGGFPCQPFSVAGKRRGVEDDRYLWPEMLRVIGELRPAWVVGENVAGIVNMALDQVLSDLEDIGYAARAFVIPACSVDAPHRRYRVAIVAYSQRIGLRASSIKSNYDQERYGSAPQQTGRSKLCTTGSGGSDVSDTKITERPRQWSKTWEWRPKSGCSGWWPTEPGLGRVAHGVPNRVDRLKCLGNAVVPKQFYPVFQAIVDVERVLNNE